MSKLTLRDLDVRGKRVLVRVDFNVPTEMRGKKVRITDDTRIRASLPTINYLREHGAKTILMAHFGRRMAMSVCSRMSVSSRRKKRTIRNSQKRWRNSVIFM